MEEDIDMDLEPHSFLALLGITEEECDGLEFQSKRAVQFNGQAGFVPIVAPSMSAVQARCPRTHTAWFIYGAGDFVVN